VRSIFQNSIQRVFLFADAVLTDRRRQFDRAVRTDDDRSVWSGSPRAFDGSLCPRLPPLSGSGWLTLRLGLLRHDCVPVKVLLLRKSAIMYAPVADMRATGGHFVRSSLSV
jgi:hypothetical protein